MPRLTLLLLVVLIAHITLSQGSAQIFDKRVFGNLKRQHLMQDKYHDLRDEDDDSNRGLNPKTLAAFLDIANNLNPNANGKFSQQKPASRIEKIKKANYQTLFDQLNGLGEDDVLIYDPDRQKSIVTARERNPVIDMLPILSNDRDVTDEEDDKAPVFVVVNVDGLQRSNLVSSLLKSSLSRQKEPKDGRQDHRYKGFQLRDSYRRARDSPEISSRENEDKRPQTRPRSYGGGRTPIPYIRHRGDIYEKDN